MIAVMIDVTPHPGRAEDYFDSTAALKVEVEAIDGFVSVERFESVTTPGKILSLSLWRDEKAIEAWREHAGHAAAQARGRNELFANYCVRIANVLRDNCFGSRTLGAGRTARGVSQRHGRRHSEEGS